MALHPGARDGYPRPRWEMRASQRHAAMLRHMPPESPLPAHAEVDAAVAALRRGEVIGLPTETVYGLAGAARDARAVARIFALKGRPADHPLIVHLAAAAQIGDWAREVPETARRLAARFWPGPLTLILKRRPEVLDLVTGGQDTVGLRVPAHPLAQALLTAFGDGVAAPSANRFGHISPTTAAHVREEFGTQVPLVLDGGPCTIGLESTIVDLSGPTPRVLRPGLLGLATLAEALGAAPADGADGSAAPRVSGTLDSHYAPRARTELVDRSTLQQHAGAPGQQLLALGTLPLGAVGLALPADARAYGAALYAALRTLDALQPLRILVEVVPDTPDWWAVRDRLRRATFNADG